MLPQLPPDKNDYTLKRKKRGKGSYKSGPYAKLNLPPPNKGDFGFQLPDGKKDSPPELFHKQTSFWALKRQKWLCALCGILCRYSDMSEWEGPVAEYKRNKEGDVKAYCPECFEQALVEDG